MGEVWPCLPLLYINDRSFAFHAERVFLHVNTTNEAETLLG